MKFKITLALPLALAAFAACGDTLPTGPACSTDATVNFGGDTITTASGLKYIEGRVGTGTPAQPGQVVRVHYTGRFLSGSTFDSSCDTRQPYDFQLGTEPRQVIAGFDETVTGMRVGGIRRAIIPPNLGYGDRQAGPIPPNSTLVFDIELLAVSGQ